MTCTIDHLELIRAAFIAVTSLAAAGMIGFVIHGLWRSHQEERRWREERAKLDLPRVTTSIEGPRE